MTVSRKKMVAGVLGLGLCGLAAVADGPQPAPINLPALPPAPAVDPAPISLPAPAPAALTPAPLQLDLPVAVPAPVELAPPPKMVQEKSIELPVQGGPVAEITMPAAPKPAVLEATPASVTPAAAVAPAAPMTDKKLRVVLAMGDERPRFEVRDGEEALLKVLCERVDVKSPSERGEPMSVLKALGKVTFVTPGGEGTCDELSVVPGTGELVVSGQVKFRYHWGKVETEVVGERMTFRLGAAAPASAAVTPASLTRSR